MKLEYYKEQYRFHLIRIFIIKFIKKYYKWILLGIVVMSITFFLWMSAGAEAKEIITKDGIIEDNIFPTEEGDKKMREAFNVTEEAFNTISKFEWYHDKPYWDHKQWSCGFGMKCSKNTTWITWEKSKWYVEQRITHIRDKYDLYRFDDQMEVALISFIYNLGHPPLWYERYIENWYINALKNRMKEYNCAGGKVLNWLVKRRAYETSLF